jgi:26S proteasome regulatory subunit N10
MRNGDYIPSRLEAQHDAANLLCGTKTQSNPESTVGVLAMAGQRCVLLARLLPRHPQTVRRRCAVDRVVLCLVAKVEHWCVRQTDLCSMCGGSVQVLASPTDNMGTLLSAIHSVNIGGVMKLSNALQVAQLALKHRRNKTGASTPCHCDLGAGRGF